MSTPAIDDRPTIESLGADLGRRIEAQLDTVFRTLMQGPATTMTPDYFRIITGEPHPLANFALMSHGAGLDATQAAAELLPGGDVPSAILVPGGIDEAVERYITSLDYLPVEVMQAMAVDLDQLASVELPAGYSLAQVDVPEDDRWCEALATGYGLPRSLANMLGPGVASGVRDAHRFRFFSVQRGGVIVATSLLFIDQGMVGVYGVATLPDERGKGLGAFITAEPLRQMRDEGYRLGLLQSSEMGEPVYRRLGFREFGQLRLFARIPEG